jgi:translation elongation factor EF-1alpha
MCKSYHIYEYKLYTVHNYPTTCRSCKSNYPSLCLTLPHFASFCLVVFIFIFLKIQDCDINVKIIQGRIRLNRNIYISGSSGTISGKVKAIVRTNGSTADALFAGESGQIKFVDAEKRKGEELNLRKGFLLYKGLPHVRCCLKIRAIILTLDNLVTPIIPGASFLMYLNGDEVQCNITKLYRVNINKSHVLKRPKSIGASKTAAVRIEFERHVCIDTFESSRALGRFALRTNGGTCAIGICEKTPKVI